MYLQFSLQMKSIMVWNSRYKVTNHSKTMILILINLNPSYYFHTVVMLLKLQNVYSSEVQEGQHFLRTAQKMCYFFKNTETWLRIGVFFFFVSSESEIIYLLSALLLLFIICTFYLQSTVCELICSTWRS